MEKIEVAKTVAGKLFATEESIDAAMIQASQLLEAMIVARRQLGFAATTGEVAQARVAEAIGAVSEARRAIMAAHGALAATGEKMGLDVTMVGGGDKEETRPTGQSHLRVAG
jgi:hypothetical protein